MPTEYKNRIDKEEVSLPDYIEGELEDKPFHFLQARRGELEVSDIRGKFSVAGQGKGSNFRKVTKENAKLGRAYYYKFKCINNL